jgi:hypothetical protein
MKRRFFFHLNKPETKRLGRAVWSLHYLGVCYQAEKIICNVPCESKSNKRQPLAVMRGFSDSVIVKDKEIEIR